jgi:hypothetical protein
MHAYTRSFAGQALSSLQISYTLVPFGTVGGGRVCKYVHNQHDHTDHQPQGPVLVDGDQVIHGGMSARRYLEDRYALGPPLSFFVPARERRGS